MSHFQYLIRTFWYGLLFAALAAAGAFGLGVATDVKDGEAIVVIVLLIAAAAAILAFCGVRIIISLMMSAAHKPIANPRTWLI